MDNPFFKEWNTPFKTTPFNEIKNEHFLPAIEEGIRIHNQEIEKIVNNSEKPTFKNTIEALELSGELLNRVDLTFQNLNSANTNSEMQEISKKIAPLLAKHTDEVNLNEKLFARIKTLYNEKSRLRLTKEQTVVLNNYYSDFVRGGVNLKPKAKERFKKINEELAVLGIKFGENILNETNAYIMAVDKKEDLAGLPQSVIQEAADKAKSKGLEGKWAFTLQKPSLIPFLQFAENRELREKLYKAYINRGNNNDQYDNKENVLKLVRLRLERSRLLGYKTYADYVLEKRMAKNPATVFKFLNSLYRPALKKAKGEVAEMQKYIDKEGKHFKFAAWDWWYYAEKVKKEKYDLDEEMLRPYFKLENVRKGAFEVATKLYGLQFEERKDIQVYHPDVQAFEVKESNGKHLGIFYTDYFPRDGKETGAWCNAFRLQSNIGGNFITPVEYNVCNFSKPTADKPALLTLEEVETLFHEFGHALHGLMSNITYPNGSGRIPVDFVELPSQIMENWATDPEVLRIYAKHYKTWDAMPKELVEKIVKSQKFNQGFKNTELLAASLLDMCWHTMKVCRVKNVNVYENTVLSRGGLIPEIASRYQSTNFRHIFAGDEYAAGYYGYIWAQVLDADAYQAFVEKGNLFDEKLALSFRKNILEKQGSDDPMAMYKRFRGREPKVDALIKKLGL
jgi:peptidyl-dipeptidase Dcp